MPLAFFCFSNTPACTTSLLRLLVPAPKAERASSTSTSRPRRARARAVARPTTPAPTTITSAWMTGKGEDVEAGRVARRWVTAWWRHAAAAAARMWVRMGRAAGPQHPGCECLRWGE